MKLIVTMMFSSSSLFLLYLLIVHPLNRCFSARWMCNILKTSLLLSFAPIGYLKVKAVQFYKLTFDIPLYTSDITINAEQPGYLIDPNGFHMTMPYFINQTILYLWLFGGTAMFSISLFIYLKKRVMMRDGLQKITSPVMIASLEHYTHAWKIRKPIQLYTCNADISPFTSGVFRPIIIIPQSCLVLEQSELILRHELMHIKHHDGLFALLQPFLLGFNWFNPLSYLLVHHLARMTEIACDESVIRNLDKAGRTSYGNLIINIALKNTEAPCSFAASFSNSNHLLKERIISIMNYKKKKVLARPVSFVLTVCMILCSSFTAFAYTSPASASIDSVEGSGFLFNDSLEFRSVPEKIPGASIIYDYQFSDDDGNIYDLNQSVAKPYAVCKHAYTDGEISTHKKNSSGGCATKYYTAKRCTKCGHLVKGALVREIKNVTCPH